MGMTHPQLTPEMVEQLRLHDIASFQKGIIACICFNLLMVLVIVLMVLGVLPPQIAGVANICAWISILLGTIFVFLLATKLYRVWLGILLGILTLVPLVGLIVLLVVNGKATRTLRENDIEVGIFGATVSLR